MIDWLRRNIARKKQKGFLYYLLIGVGLIAVGGWSYFAVTWLFPELWGPYAKALAHAGPVAFSRGGFLLALGMPVMALWMPLINSERFIEWFAKQIVCLILVGGAWLSYGYYLHHLVHFQGLEPSTELLAAEVGFENSAAVPAHIKEAFSLSEKLANEGKAPWLPGAWKVVSWPAIPAN